MSKMYCILLAGVALLAVYTAYAQPVPELKPEIAGPPSYAEVLLDSLVCVRAAVPRPIVLGILEERYEETATASIYISPGAVAEVFVNYHKGTWTMLLTRPDGFSCVVAAGRHQLRKIA